MAKTITYTKIEGKPKEPGYYLLLVAHTEEVFDHVMVIEYPAKFEYGLQWDAYLGIPKWNGRHADCFSGDYYKMD